MKKLLVVTMVACLLAGSAMLNISGRQPHQLPEAARNIQTRVRFAPPPPGHLVPAKLARKLPTTVHSLTRSREEQARLLRLEIERALLSVDDTRRDRAYRQLLP